MYLDEALYGPYRDAAAYSIQYTDKNTSDYPEFKAAVLAGRNTPIDGLTPKTYTQEQYEAELSRLEQLTHKIQTSETRPAIAEMYLEAIANRVSMITARYAASERNPQLFIRAQESMWGLPDAASFRFIIPELRDLLRQAEESTPEMRAKAESIKRRIPILPQVTNPPNPLSEQALQVCSTITLLEFSRYFNFITPNLEKFTPEQVSQIFQTILNHECEGWNIKPKKTGPYSMNAAKKTLNIPNDRTVSRKRLSELAVHEIGTHIARIINGDRNQIHLLRSGFAGTIRGEEGLATLRESFIRPENFSPYSLAFKFLGPALAMGVDGTPRSLQEVFELLREIYEIKYNFEQDPTIEESDDEEEEETPKVSRAVKKAWTIAERTFNGNPNLIPGIANTRGTIYLCGRLRLMELLQTNPELLRYMNVGRFNPVNMNHWKWLRELEVIK